MSSTLEKAEKCFMTATEAESRSEYGQALSLYEQANDCYQQVLQYETLKGNLHDKVAQCKEKAEQMKKYSKFKEQTSGGEGHRVAESSTAAAVRGGERRGIFGGRWSKILGGRKKSKGATSTETVTVTGEREQDLTGDQEEPVKNKGSQDLASGVSKSSTFDTLTKESPTLPNSALKKSAEVFKKAMEADKNKKFEEALPLYEQAIEYLLQSMKNEAHSEESIEFFRTKHTRYSKRVEELRMELKKSTIAPSVEKGIVQGSKNEVSDSDVSKSIRVAGEEGGERNECVGEKTKAEGVAGEERGEGIGESMKGKSSMDSVNASGVSKSLTSSSAQVTYAGRGAGTAIEKAIDLVKKATEADNDKRYDEALPLYEHAIDYFLHALKYEASSDRSRESIRAKCAQYLERAEQLKRYLKKKAKVSMPQGGVGGRGGGLGKSGKSRQYYSSQDNSDSDDVDDEDTKITASLKKCIVVELNPNVPWDDVAGLRVAKESLKENALLPMKFPHMFQSKQRQISRCILLYGPPGTGKSYLAKAVATAGGCTFFSVSSTDFVSRWFGQGEKLVKGLFEMARNKKPAVVFFDHVESLFCSQNKTYKQSDNTKAEFLVQMQKICMDNDGILVLGATDLPWSLDSAICRRFQKRIYIPLPEASARRRMFQVHIGTMKTLLTDQDYQTLAQKTEGYSGADIEVLVREAAMMPIRKFQTATHFKVVSGPSPKDPSIMRNDLLVPCSSSDPGAMEMSWMNVPGDRLLEPPVTMDDFLKAIDNTRLTVTSADLKQFEDWTKDFGQ